MNKTPKFKTNKELLIDNLLELNEEFCNHINWFNKERKEVFEDDIEPTFENFIKWMDFEKEKTICKNCDGRGDVGIGLKDCNVCNGTGKVTKHKTILD